ncbi:MAG TPA: PstS family phosphate ABC transporter substrate-binding protein [Acidimicrobiales bacterium]|nr:PstS family phosphate ABC transporter substrate-binding protein [Acidimicrobiales bacterium]
MRTPHHRSVRLSAALVALTLLAAACGGDDATTAGSGNGTDGDLSGTVNIDGSSTVAPLTEVAAELFMEQNSGVRVTVAVSGTSGGFQKFCNGETDGNDASRAIKESEIELCEQNGIAYDNVQVANDALSIVVNLENPLDCLTVDQASQIWDEGSSVSTWGDIDGLDLDSTAERQSITLYGPGTDSGTFDFFTEAINGEEGKIRNDYTDIGEDDFAAVTAVQGDPWAMGYIPYSFVQEAGDAVKPLQIDDGDGCVDATLDNVQSGDYSPLGRPLFLYASDTALARAEVQAFFDFYIENQEEIADLAGFVPMNDDQVSDAEAKVAALTG